MSAFETVGLQEEFVHVVGYEAAARWTGRGLTKEGSVFALRALMFLRLVLMDTL